MARRRDQQSAPAAAFGQRRKRISSLRKPWEVVAFHGKVDFGRLSDRPIPFELVMKKQRFANFGLRHERLVDPAAPGLGAGNLLRLGGRPMWNRRQGRYRFPAEDGANRERPGSALDGREVLGKRQHPTDQKREKPVQPQARRKQEGL